MEISTFGVVFNRTELHRTCINEYFTIFAYKVEITIDRNVANWLLANSKLSSLIFSKLMFSFQENILLADDTRI